MPQIIYHFDCKCDIPADQVKRSCYNPKTQQNEMRCFCPNHLDARLVEKTIYCQCGCNKPFRVNGRRNNKKYHDDCARRIKLEKQAAWHKRQQKPMVHHQTEYVAPKKISPIRKHKPFKPGDIGMEFPVGFSNRDLLEMGVEVEVLL